MDVFRAYEYERKLALLVLVSYCNTIGPGPTFLIYLLNDTRK